MGILSRRYNYFICHTRMLLAGIHQPFANA
jgi:hypothetical protein